MYCPHCGKFIEEKNKNKHDYSQDTGLLLTKQNKNIHWIHPWNGLGR